MSELMFYSWSYIRRWDGDNGSESEGDGRDMSGLEVLRGGGGEEGVQLELRFQSQCKGISHLENSVEEKKRYLVLGSEVLVQVEIS